MQSIARTHVGNGPTGCARSAEAWGNGGNSRAYILNRDGAGMHDLWAGVDLKTEYANFFLQEMSRSLRPPEGAQRLEAAGGSIDTPWERSFYPCLDAFLAMTRSIPEIIQSCFGVDADRRMKAWFNALPCAERRRRQAFSNAFEPCHSAFRQHSLSNARNISFHRTGYPSVEVSITGRFGVVHTGSPVQSVPTAESRPLEPNISDNPALMWAATRPPVPVRPRWDQFTIDGKPLFAECRAYLALAQQLADKAHGISQCVHGTATLTAPPSS
jgi:hypothetical protein